MALQHVLDCAVIGAGPAGLAVSGALATRGVDHLALERGQAGESWRTQRWESFRLNTPGWMNHMLGDQQRYQYLERIAVVERLDALAANCPIRTGVRVVDLALGRNGYLIQTDDEMIQARTVVVATGDQNVPRLPAIAQTLPAWIAQFHTATYRGPASLTPGGVLVVGSAQSGCQIAEDLLFAGRRVVIATSPVTRLPWSHRGRDSLEWLTDAGFWDQRPQDLPDPAMIRAPQPVLGSGGHSLSLQWLARHGATLTGRPVSLSDDLLIFDDTAEANIAAGDAGAARLRGVMDEQIRRTGLDAPSFVPEETDAPISLDAPTALHLRDEDITSIVWCTGFTGDFSWLSSELRNPDGLLRRDGVRGARPGLWYAGLRWLTRRRSAIFFGFLGDAEVIGDEVKAQLEQEAR
jgi:putative flavoprotein involved in K+ transport